MFRKIWFLIAAFMMVSFSATQSFAMGCYTKSEAEAEQGIRIHSELMVISLNCQHMGPPGEQNLYLTYRQWTKKHEKIFAGYEDTLMFYFSRNGEKAPEKRLNTLRTNFANKISLEAAKMRPDIFCNHYVQRIDRADKLDKAQIKDWASTFYASHPVSNPICHQ
jgi:hypothetical protein